jgi:hypothetical protein
MRLSIIAGPVVGCLAMLAAVQPAKAAQSHLMQAPERHVVLRDVYRDPRAPVGPCGSSWDRDFAEVSPMGTLADTPFSIPDGFVLVVTDIDWRVDEGDLTAFVPGRVLQFTIHLGSPLAPVFTDGRLIDGHDGGVIVESKSLTTGFRVAPGTPICASAHGVDEFGGARHDVTTVILRGYVIQDSGRKVSR